MTTKTVWVYTPLVFIHQINHSLITNANDSSISKTTRLIEPVKILSLCTINGNNILFQDFKVGWLFACKFDLLVWVGETLTVKNMKDEIELLVVLSEFMMSLNCLQFGLLNYEWIVIWIYLHLACVSSLSS